jgi:hypothetical protein
MAAMAVSLTLPEFRQVTTVRMAATVFKMDSLVVMEAAAGMVGMVSADRTM